MKQNIDDWKYESMDERGWLDAFVPGSIHLDLIRNKIISDPFYGQIEEEVQWIGKNDWNYRSVFDQKAEVLKMPNKVLYFHGLDTFSEVILNSHSILNTNNMFHSWEVDVTELLKEKNNILEVKFFSPINRLSKVLKDLPYNLPADNDKAGGVSPFIRKAPYHFGWDWGPCLVTMGIWKNVDLIGWNSFRSHYVSINQKAFENGSATIETEIEIESKVDTNATIMISSSKGKVSDNHIVSIKKGYNSLRREVKIKNPLLWWPVGHGNQSLYQFNISIEIDGETQHFTKRIGIRDIKLNTSIDKSGNKFEIVINGKAIFCKGANWIPTDSFTTRTSKAKYQEIIDHAINANFNTIRVWGGGIYENDDFYDICDEKGLIVWQDFMFACSLYPGDAEFLDSVKEEADYQIKRLKHHPSIVLWCGNNEVGVAWHNWEWKENLPSKLFEKDYNELFHKILPLTIDKCDGTRPYWPTSPGLNDELPKSGQSLNSGDFHYWGVWHAGEPINAYNNNIGRFMSEYGMQSFPSIDTIKDFCTIKELDEYSNTISAHQKASLGNKNLDKYLYSKYPRAKDFESYIILTQLMQSDALRTAIEAHRSAMPFCMGSLYWQLNDCWPGISWSTIDYFGNWKASHYEVKKAFEPLLIVVSEKEGSIKINVINEGATIKDSMLKINLLKFDGRNIFSSKVDVPVIETGVKNLYELNEKSTLDKIEKSQSIMRLELIKKRKVIASKDYFFSEPKSFTLEKPSFNFTVKEINSKIHIQVSAFKFLYKLYFSCKSHRGVFDDNFIVMLPGEQKTIKFHPNNTNLAHGGLPVFELKTFYELIEH